MTYSAIINMPGYLPGGPILAIFETAAEAWQYLADERGRTQECWILVDPDDEEGPQKLDACQLAIEEFVRRDRIGTVYSDDGRLAFSVDYAHDGFEAGAL